MKLIHLFPPAVAILVFCGAAQAQFTPIVDDFSTAGNLTGSTPDSGVGNWTTISGSAALVVSSGTLSLIAGAGEASQLNFSSSDVTAGTLYLGFDFLINSQSISTTTSASAIAGFRAGTPASGSYSLGFSTFRPTSAAQTANTLPNTTTSQFAVGIFSGSTANIATIGTISGWNGALDMGTRYRAVIGFNLTGDTASLWISPTSSGSTSITLSGIPASARGAFLRQGAATHGAVTIDNLDVTTDFDTAAAIAIPEPSTCAAIIGAVAVAGVMFRRHMRQTKFIV